MENRDEFLLNEIYRNVRMATWAIDTIYNAIQDQRLRDLVDKQNDVYEELTHSCEKLGAKLDIDLKDINPIEKGMSWMGIKMGTLTNKETSHIAEKLIQGTTMGITQMITTVADSECENKEIREIANHLKRNEEVFIEGLKEFLMK